MQVAASIHQCLRYHSSKHHMRRDTVLKGINLPGDYQISLLKRFLKKTTEICWHLFCFLHLWLQNRYRPPTQMNSINDPDIVHLQELLLHHSTFGAQQHHIARKRQSHRQLPCWSLRPHRWHIMLHLRPLSQLISPPCLPGPTRPDQMLPAHSLCIIVRLASINRYDRYNDQDEGRVPRVEGWQR